MKAIKNTHAALLLMITLFSCFAANAGSVDSVKQKRTFASEETQSFAIAAGTRQKYYSFRSRPERTLSHNRFSSNDSLVLSTIVNLMKENVVISKTSLGINFVWKW